MGRITGKKLIEKWGIPAEHALYRETGDWYQMLERFPGALCDIDGYILFQTEEEYRSNKYLVIKDENNHTHVKDGISSIPGYVKGVPVEASEDSFITAEIAIQTCNISK